MTEKRSFSITRRSALAVLLVLLAVLPMLFASCGKGGENATPAPQKDGSGLTDAQKAEVLAVAEMFLESGTSMDSESGVQMRDLEKYIFWLYNGEREPGESGFARVSGAEADERIKRYFGIMPMIRTSKRSGVQQDIYYMNESYYVRANEPAAVSSEILSCETVENGFSTVRVRLEKADGSATELILLLDFGEGRQFVRGCDRLESR